MIFLRKSFYFLIVFFSFTHFSQASFPESDKIVEEIHHNIVLKTIFSAEEIKTEFKEDSHKKALISDCDLVITAISNVDSSLFFRDPNIGDIYTELMKQDIPVIIATARWLHERDITEHGKYAHQMEKESGLKL